MDELDQLLQDLTAADGTSAAGSSSSSDHQSAPTAKPQPQSSSPPSSSPLNLQQTPAKDRSSMVPPAVKAHQELEQLVAKPLTKAQSFGRKGQTCAGCKAVIGESEQSVMAIGAIYHTEHFQCAKCSKLLAGGVFFERDSKPCCEACVADAVLLCAFCGENIKGKCTNALDKHWHPEHFFCSQCGQHFPPGGDFMERDGKAYCENDYYNMFAPKCGVCDKPIMTEVISALGKAFHLECFICAESTCKLQLANAGSFFEHHGKAYCEQHYHAQRGSLCASCQKPIVGRCLTAIGKKFHPEHFVCAYCKKQLNSTTTGGAATFRDHEGKPFCVGCFTKLHG